MTLKFGDIVVTKQYNSWPEKGSEYDLEFRVIGFVTAIDETQEICSILWLNNSKPDINISINSVIKIPENMTQHIKNNVYMGPDVQNEALLRIFITSILELL